ncbi:MAG: YggS family pyridoxal phosphate-dependent enzyme [Planctomycetota bacterium]
MTIVGTLETRYEEVMQRVREAAERSGRTAESILTVAVGKYAELEDIRTLIAMGHRDFGESRVQQLVHRAVMIEEQIDREHRMPRVTAEGAGISKQDPLLSGDDLRWHMIGRLQRNKAKKLIGVARLVHAVDSLKLADELQQYAIKKDIETDVLVQINSTDEADKGGVAMPAAPHLAQQIDDMFPLRIRGYMTMGPTSRDRAQTQDAFERTADLFRETAKTGLGDGHFNILSMGMSGDYEMAIEAGANIVRVGSAIFGEREVEQIPEED